MYNTYLSGTLSFAVSWVWLSFDLQWKYMKKQALIADGVLSIKSEHNAMNWLLGLARVQIK